MTQCEMIMEYMREHGSITQGEASREIGCTRLAARIADLEERGNNILHETITVKNRFGKKVTIKRYSILKAVGG